MDSSIKKTFRWMLYAVLLSHASLAAAQQQLSITLHPPSIGSLVLNSALHTVQITGPIDAGAPDRLRELLKRIPDDGDVQFYLDSPGGNVAASMEIGRIIRAQGLSTHIGRYNGGTAPAGPGVCYSACALAFLGGPFRWISEGSQYGVHRFYAAEATARDMEIAQVLSASIATYIREMEADPELMTIMAGTPKERVTVLNAKQLKDLGVVNNGRRPPKWSIEAVPLGLYLKGEQLTYFGLGKALFFCDTKSGRIVFNSMAPIAADQAPSMVRGEWEHSLLIDSDPERLPFTKGTFDGKFLNTYFFLTPAQVARISQAKKVGHALQVDRAAPVFVGYEVDVPLDQSQKIKTFLSGCRAS